MWVFMSKYVDSMNCTVTYYVFYNSKAMFLKLVIFQRYTPKVTCILVLKGQHPSTQVSRYVSPSTVNSKVPSMGKTWGTWRKVEKCMTVDKKMVIG